MISQIVVGVEIQSVKTFGPGGMVETKVTFPMKAGERFGCKIGGDGHVTHVIAVPPGEPDPEADDPRWVPVESDAES